MTQQKYPVYNNITFMVNVINVMLCVYSHYGHNVIFGYNLDKHERIRISLHLNCTGSTFFEISFKVYLFIYFLVRKPLDSV